MDLSHYPHTGWVITGIVVFFFVRLGIGYWAARQVNNAADFVVAGRGLPIYMTASSIMATWFAAETLMGASAHAYEHGFQGVIFDPFGAVLCLAVSGVFFIRLMRRARYLTVVDFFDKRFGKEFGFISSLVQILAYLVWTAAQFVAGSVVVHSLLGWPPWVGIVIVGVIVTGYTTMGGMLADTVLDFIQMFFTAGGITALFIAVLSQVGGMEGMLNHGGSRYVPEPFSLLPLPGSHGYLGYTGHMGTFYWISAWLTIGLGSVATQDLMQRSMSARNEATSVWGSYIAAILYFTFGVMSPLIGIMIYKLNPNIPEDQVESLLVMASVQYLPVWMNVLFIAALTSAMMSTSDSAILAGASVFTENIAPLIGMRLDDIQKLKWTRIMVVVIGTACMVIALLIGETYRLALMAWSVLLVGMFAPFAFGMYWNKANRCGAIASTISGAVVWVVGIVIYYPSTIAANLDEGGVVDWGVREDAIWDAVYIASTPAFVVSVVLMVLVSLATYKWDKPLPLTDVDGNPLPLKNRLGTNSFRDVFRDEPAPATEPSQTT
ncbi:MAG TPA: sodium:solute symporter family protein [Planctomycetaceae bacterium]|nr:sodium:solute symporter family protein [Planctomycetaceae bacterium]